MKEDYITLAEEGEGKVEEAFVIFLKSFLSKNCSIISIKNNIIKEDYITVAREEWEAFEIFLNYFN